MSRPLPPKDQRKLIKSMRAQGCEIVKTNMGVRILFPNGDSVSMHRTHGDYRARENLRAQIRRAGLDWPL